MNQESLFEPMDAEEFRRENRPRSTTRKIATEPRLRTVWFDLPTWLEKCTVPSHDEVMANLPPEKRVYRENLTIRMVYEIDGLLVCRDCFLVGADKDANR